MLVLIVVSPMSFAGIAVAVIPTSGPFELLTSCSSVSSVFPQAFERMELERPDVGFFILCIFLQSAFELSVFFETMLLCHLFTFRIGLYDAPFSTEIFHLSVEYGVLAELAFQRSVEDRYLDRRLQTDLFEALFAVTSPIIL